MNKITLELLRRKGACPSSLDKFAALWPAGVVPTKTLALKHAADFDWNWAANNLLLPKASAEYERARALAGAEYRRVRALAWDEYRRAQDSAWGEYERVQDLASAEYERARALARGEYRRVRALAWDEYERVRALAQGEYERAQAQAFVRQFTCQDA